MAVDWFLIDAPYEVPDEYSAWQSASTRLNTLILRIIDVRPGTEAFVSLQEAARDAKREADRLEAAARAAWKLCMLG
jgi:hypothetical protein